MYGCSHTSSSLPGQVSQSQFHSFLLPEYSWTVDFWKDAQHFLDSSEHGKDSSASFKCPVWGPECLGKPGWQWRVCGLPCMETEEFLCGKWRAQRQQGGLDTAAVCTPAFPGSSGAFPHSPEVSPRVGGYLDWPCCHPLFASCPWEERTSPEMSQTLSLLLRQPWGGHPTPAALGDGGEGGNTRPAVGGALSTPKCSWSIIFCWVWAGLATSGAQRMQRPRGVAPQWLQALLHPQFSSAVGGAGCTLLRRIYWLALDLRTELRSL